MKDLNEKAHTYLIDKGCVSIGQLYSAFQMQKMLVDFAQQQLNTSDVSDSTIIKDLHEALKNLLQATDDEGWNCNGEDWKEQSEARKALAKVPKKYLS